MRGRHENFSFLTRGKVRNTHLLLARLRRTLAQTLFFHRPALLLEVFVVGLFALKLRRIRLGKLRV